MEKYPSSIGAYLTGLGKYQRASDSLHYRDPPAHLFLMTEKVYFDVFTNGGRNIRECFMDYMKCIHDSATPILPDTYDARTHQLYEIALDWVADVLLWKPEDGPEDDPSLDYQRAAHCLDAFMDVVIMHSANMTNIPIPTTSMIA